MISPGWTAKNRPHKSRKLYDRNRKSGIGTMITPIPLFHLGESSYLCAKFPKSQKEGCK